MAEAVAAESDTVRAERISEQRRLYQDFLSLNYRVFEKYCRIRDIFKRNANVSHRSPAERLREQDRLDEVNQTIVHLSTVIRSLEKKSESLLFSD